MELRIAVTTELTSADGKLLNCDGVAAAAEVCSCEVRLAGGPSDMVGNIDGGNIVFEIYYVMCLFAVMKTNRQAEIIKGP